MVHTAGPCPHGFQRLVRGAAFAVDQEYVGLGRLVVHPTIRDGEATDHRNKTYGGNRAVRKIAHHYPR